MEETITNFGDRLLLKLPRVRPVEIRKDGKDFHLCKDERSGSSIDNPAGGLNIFWKYEDPKERALKQIDRNHRKMERLIIELGLTKETQGLVDRVLSGAVALKSPMSVNDKG